MTDEKKTPESETPEDAPQPEPAAADDGAAAREADPAPADPAEEAAAEAPDEAAVLKDRLLRALAENENVVRRARKDREDAAKYAAAHFARDMLSVADNLRRALDSMPQSLREDEAGKTLAEGLDLTEKELLAALERHGIKRISPMGEKFNHDLHEAMFEVPTNDAPPGTVVQVMEDGYVIHDRLLRAARVGVAKALPESGHTVDTTA
ncbi:MAG: nucleotide exchange factor GrpE [Alphaproteobacteria bacterium]|nr:nucleotide exchange factor GrpE [Alphaproteobacteria bacterium]